MLTASLLDHFLDAAAGQALREGKRYATESRVARFIGSSESVTTVVRGATGEFDVLLWTDRGALEHRCSCPSWRDPCKHEVAAVVVLRAWLRRLEGHTLTHGAKRPRRSTSAAARLGASRAAGRKATRVVLRGAAATPAAASVESARDRAIASRALAASDEDLVVTFGAPGRLKVKSTSGFAYAVTLRGGVDGPHGCVCPDFEANRLHTCKHVERVRGVLRSPGYRLPQEHALEAARARVYLHFGETVEPRLFGRPSGRGAEAVLGAFDARGLALGSALASEAEILERLAPHADWVEPEAIAWLERRAARRPELPEGDFRALLPKLGLEPYPYQFEGAAFLARTGRALLADEMGLGKTVQALLAAVALRSARRPVRSVTVVCPASLRGGWQDEIARWLGEQATLVEGTPAERADAIARGAPWLVTHYEQLVRDAAAHRAHPPDLLIIDEAQRAKGLSARTARLLKTIEAPHVFALTGTPLENRLEEAYAVAQLIDQRLLPPLWQIERDHMVRDPEGRRVVLYRDLGSMRSRLAPAFLRRRKEDVAVELPERVRSIVFVPLHEAVLPTYDDVMGQVAAIAARRPQRPGDVERMQRLLVIARRCCNGPHMLGLEVEDSRVPKLAELAPLLRDLCVSEGRKAVVFSEWTDMTLRVEALARDLGLAVFHLHGGVPVADRQALIQGFKDTVGPAVFVSTDAGGVGLNLQAADVLVNLDLPWNPGRLEQRIARVHRIGSRKTVQVVLLVAKDSLEERILALHDTKQNVLANVWAKDGEDVIAAPGGSARFRDMVQSLVAVGEEDVAAPSGGSDVGRATALADAASHAPRASRAPASAAPADAPPALASGAVGPGPASFPAPAAKRTPSTRAVAAHTGVAPVTAPPPSQPTLVSEPPRNVVDPDTLVRAMAAIAPALPPEHRTSLAEALRALADAIDSDTRGRR